MRRTLQKLAALTLGLSMLAGGSVPAAETGEHWYYEADDQFVFQHIAVKDVKADAENKTLTFRSIQEEDGSMYCINRETVFEGGNETAEATAEALLSGELTEIDVYIPLWEYHALNRGKDNETQVVAVAGLQTESAGESTDAESKAAFAEMKTLEVPVPDASEPFAILKAFKILEGNADMDGTVTRGEMVQLLINTLHLKNAAYGPREEELFSDVREDHSNADAIYMAQAMKHVAGFGDGTFRPDEPVTAEQAVKLVVSMLGYRPMAEANGGYPVGYMQASAQIGLTDGFTMPGNAPITRAAAAQLLENALYMPTMEQTYYKPGAEEYEVMDGTGGRPLIRFIDRYWRY